jgi:hypothetical protein
MSHESDPSRSPRDLAFVCWRGGDGARVEGCPMERDQAEALARAYAEFFPRQTYWVEPVPWMERVIPNATRSAPR